MNDQPYVFPFNNAGGYTTFDNAILDLIMPLCEPNEWKIVCATLRKTRGWSKDSDFISVSQYMKLTGIRNRTTCVNAIQKALNHKFLVREPYGKQAYKYALNKGYRIHTSTETVLVTSTETVPVTSTETVPTKESIKTKLKKTVVVVKENALFNDVIKEYKHINGTISPTILENLAHEIAEWDLYRETLPENHISFKVSGFSAMIEAIKITQLNGAHSFRYIQGIFNRWRKNGYMAEKKKRGKKKESDQEYRKRRLAEMNAGSSNGQ
jgi:phage replication O-like protein O